jgi:small subunit ribosomal protein S6
VNSYEAMFLMDPAMATDFTTAETEVKRILDRAEAKGLGLKKWDERRLAYDIKRNKRGLYVLTFFEAAPEKIAGIERDVQLSESVLRVLVVRHEKLTPEAVDKALNAPPPPRPGTRHDEWGGGGFRPPRPDAGDEDSDPDDRAAGRKSAPESEIVEAS